MFKTLLIVSAILTLKHSMHSIESQDYVSEADAHLRLNKLYLYLNKHVKLVSQ